MLLGGTAVAFGRSSRMARRWRRTMKTLLTGTAVAALLLASPARADDSAPVPNDPTTAHAQARDHDRDQIHDATHSPTQAAEQDRMHDRAQDRGHDAARAGAGDRTRERLHEQMHEAMLDHAPVPTGRPEMPGRALADTMRAHAGEQHEAAATQAAERHALRHGVVAGAHHDGAGRPGMVPGGGMRSGTGPGAGGECGDAAGARRMMDMHGGDMGGGGTGGMDGTGGHGGTGTGTGGMH
jgi:hypothetical protein